MVKKPFYRGIWILGVIAGIVCILLALVSFLGHIPEILEKPMKGFTGLVSAGILGIMGALIMGSARMTKAGGQRATTGGVFLLIFGLVAYMVGGAIGASIALLTGVLAVIAKHI